MQRKALALNLLSALAGLGLLAGVEGILQLCDLGPSPRLFALAETAGEKVYTANRDVTYRFFQHPYRRSSPLVQSFAADKAPEVVRVFALGASTLVGFPHPVSAAFPHYLEKMLPAAYPERRFEVINCGITALNTFCLVDFMREIANYDPDLVILYAGHNEFMGPYGVTTPFVRVGNDRTMIRFLMLLQRSRIYYYLGELIAYLQNWAQPEETTPSFGLHLAREEIGPLDAGYSRTAENFRANLEEIALIAAGHEIPLLFSTLVANLKDFHPLRSECDAATPAIEALTAAGHWAEAERQARNALRENPYCANLHFTLGRQHYLRGEYGEAKAAFTRARDMDRLPFRAPTLFNQILREVAASSNGVLLCEVEATFSAASPHGIVGSELISEYVHPTVFGHYLIARTMIETLAASPLAGQWGASSTLGKYEDYRPSYPPLEEVWRRNDLMLFLKRMPYNVPPAALSRRLAGLIAVQLAALPHLQEAERRQFIEQGGLRFLRRMLEELHLGDRPALQRALAEVSGGV
ncbi:MAG: hypothetical protein F4X75_24210 [Gemmatimonadetes bacterium]|nr:hypothetical protein [Gemmatimonadota bacterium]